MAKCGVILILVSVMLLTMARVSFTQVVAEDPTVERFLVTANSDPRGNELVKDQDARTGWALCADPAKRSGTQFLRVVYSYNQAAGKVRGTFRLKVADNSRAAVVAVIRVFMNNGELKVREAGYQELQIRGTDFRARNVYQDFSLDILKGERGFGDWAVSSKGVIPVWFDGLVVTQASRLSSTELLALLEPPVKPANLVLSRAPLRVHETHGLFMEYWKVREAVGLLATSRAPGAVWTQSYLTVHPQHTELAGFPAKWEDLYAQSAVVLNNTPAKAVSLVGTMMLKQYVEDGGCVILLGDTHGLVAGGWGETALTPLLPVIWDKGDDLMRPAAPLPLQPSMIFSGRIDWAAKPYTRYYHRATVRPDAHVLLASGDIPLIVERPAGKGHVLVVLASVFGDRDAAAPGLPFWEWSDWPAMLAEILIRYTQP